jgi:hypothetical protein
MPSPDTCLCSPAAGRIKRDSAYRFGAVVVEYRWHPLHGKTVPLYRRTVHGGVSVVHVETDDDKTCRQLPAWMVDASICRGMEVGSPQVSLAALRELAQVINASPPAVASGLVSSLKKENESIEPTAKITKLAVATAVRVREQDCVERERESGSDSGISRSATRSRESVVRRRGQKRDKR